MCYQEQFNLIIHPENVLKTSRRRLKTSRTSLEDILTRHLQDAILNTCSKRLGITSWRCVEDLLAIRLENVLMTSWRCITKSNVFALENVFVFWRRMTKVNIFVLLETSWRRLLKTKTKDVFKMSSSRQMFPGIGVFNGNYMVLNTYKGENTFAKNAHREKAHSNKSPALTRSMNVNIW